MTENSVHLHGLFVKKITPKYKKIYLCGIPVFYKKKKIKLEDSINELKEFIYQTMWLPQKVAELHKQVFPQFKSIHEGEDIVIVGCGPTLFHYTPIKGAKHISLNRAFRYKGIKFDYAFIWDLPGLAIANDGCVEDFLNYDCTKFVGKFLSERIPISEYIENKKGKLYRCYSSSRYPFLDPIVDPVIHADLSLFPLVDFMSISFGALHFASWTHPRRIYLVGLDTVINGSFDGRQNPYNFQEMFKGYRLFKEFMQNHYPETEIISINPIGLKGLFKDMYTQSYLDKHPELKNENVEILK